MGKTSRKLLLALLTIAASVALLVAGTYALFSRDFTVTNHLSAGNLTVTLTRTKLETVTLDEHGHLVSSTETTATDFTEATGENLFGLVDGAEFAPGCKYTAELRLSNAGTVAFSYWLEIIVTDDSDAGALADQLVITLKSGETTKEATIGSDLSIGSEGEGVGIVDVGASTQFSVSVEFRDNANNSAAQDKSVKFDLVIHAVQDANVQ